MHRRIAAEDDDAVGHLDRLLDIVRDDDDALGRHAALQPQIDDVAAQRLGGQHVERRERLVEQQHVGIDDERAGEADALAHAARQFLGIGGFEPVEADQVDGRNGALAPLGARHALRLEPELDIAEHGEPGKQREGLEHHGDALRRPVQLAAAIMDRCPRGRRSGRRGCAGRSICPSPTCRGWRRSRLRRARNRCWSRRGARHGRASDRSC